MTEFTFLSVSETYTRIDHIVDYKESLNQFQNIEIIQRMLFDHSGIKLRNQ